jgi:sulfonate transport system ATP-binding protein
MGDGVTRAGVGLQLVGLEKCYGDRRVLRGLDLEVREGEFVAIVGRSGCGKSTLLRLIAGLDAPDAGTIAIGETLAASAAARSAVRMIFQDARLLPWQTVLANVSLGVGPASKGAPRTEREARARAVLADVGLADHAGEWPGRLSGGQRQRVALARGLMSEPRLLLLDEPLGALDALTRLEMHQLITRLWQAWGFTAVFVTHDIQEAVALADRVIVLEEGAIVADERLAIARPRAPLDRRFVETAALLLGRILGTSASTPPRSIERVDDPIPDSIAPSPAARERTREHAEGLAGR